MKFFDYEDVVAVSVYILLEVAFALNRAGNAPPPPPPPPPQLPSASFMGLPDDIHIRILELIDLNTVCRIYAACSGHPSFDSFDRSIAYHLRRRSVEVTPEHVVKGDHTKINFESLWLLPPCHAHIKTSVGMWELTKTWISKLKFWSLKITVYNEFPSGYEVLDLKGLQGNPIALHFDRIRDFDTADIPKSVKRLQITECTFEGRILDIGALAASLTTLRVDVTKDFAFPCASSLSNLQHYTGKYVADLPWSQLKTVVVDRIPSGIRCDSLEEVTFTSWFDSTFKNIHCPNLNGVSFHILQDGHISDYFNDDQLIRLKTFRGEDVALNDLTMLPNVEVLHVKYDQTLFRHTALPPHLVELKIVSGSPVEGIPDQLTVFEYLNQMPFTRPFITVESTTLKRLSIQGARRSTVVCPHLEELALRYIMLAVSDTLNVRKLSLERASMYFAKFPGHRHFPNLRQLHLKHYDPSDGFVDLVISKDHHLESVTLEGSTLDKVSLSADKVFLKRCTFTQTPSINAIALESDDSLPSGDGIASQELACNAIERIPNMVEKLRINGGDPIAVDSLIGCENLKALSIACLPKRVQDKLNIPESVEKLCLHSSDELKVNVRPQQLKWYQWSRTDHKYIAPGMIANLAVQVGPYLVCRSDALPASKYQWLHELVLKVWVMMLIVGCLYLLRLD